MAHIPLDVKLRAVSSSKGRLIVALLCFVLFTATKLSSNRSLLEDSANEFLDSEEKSVQSFADRNNCQIIYILGVEGSVHHGFSPVLETLARRQIDPATDTPYVVTYADVKLRAALFGFRKEARPLDNPTLVREVIRTICPRNGKKHVIIEDTSFPSGKVDDPRSYRIHRQPWWSESPIEEIAMSNTALNHPTNLNSFYEAYSPYADIKFVVLHRPYIETVASNYDQDGTAEQHSNVVRGFMLLLRRFLDSHPTDEMTGQRLWTLVCVERMMSNYYSDSGEMVLGGQRVEGNEQMNLARQHILGYLVDFLGWPLDDCPECFSDWKGSNKNHLEVLGEDNVAIVLEHMRKLGGVWPPVAENALPEQKCTL